MSLTTYLLYAAAFGGWAYAVHREGGIGLGFRFLYALHFSMFFLVGPLLGAAFGQPNPKARLIQSGPSVILSLVGLASYLIMAYGLFPRFSPATRLDPLQLRKRLANPVRLESQYRVAWTLIAMGILCLPLISRTQGIATIGAVLSQTTYLFDTGLAMLCIYGVAGGKRRWFMVAGPLFLVRGAAFAAMSGHSGALFIHAMVFACLWTFAFRATARRALAVLAIAIVIMIPASMWLSGRAELRQSLKRGVGFVDRFGIFLDIFSEVPTLDLDKMVASYRERGDFSYLMARAVDHTPAVQPYAEGETYYHAVFALVPRIVWPSKPIHAGGNAFVTKYTGVKFDKYTSVAMAHFFEFYVNFGTAGVVVGMAAMGALMGWMESLYFRRGVDSLFVEYTLLFVNWTITFWADRASMVLMSVAPALVLCFIIRVGLNACVSWPHLKANPVRRPAPIGALRSSIKP